MTRHQKNAGGYTDIKMIDSTHKIVLSTLDPRKLELILYPTEKCNFRCTYCYEDFLLGQMPRKVIQGVKNLLERRLPSLSSLRLSWFGGEPLVAKQVVREISEYAYSLCAERDVALQGSMTTNGYFLDVLMAQKFSEINLTNYQISLDGYGEGHDTTRRLASGRGSFQRIWSNLCALKNSDIDFHIDLRIHLTPENIHSVEELACRLKETLLLDSRFTAFLKPIENWGGANSGRMEVLGAQERIVATRRINTLLDISEDKEVSNAVKATHVCYASRPNSLAIRSDGRIQKCTIALNDDRNTVGQLLEDGSVQLDEHKMHAWMRGYGSQNLAELACPMQDFPLKKKKVIPIISV